MKAEDIYPNLAVWIRGNFGVWPGIVVKVKEYVGKTIRSKGFMCRDEGKKDDPDNYYFCYNWELEPRDPNNMDEVPPDVLLEHEKGNMITEGVVSD